MKKGRLRFVLSITALFVTWPIAFARSIFGVEALDGRFFEYSEGWGAQCESCREEHAATEACPFGGIA